MVRTVWPRDETGVRMRKWGARGGAAWATGAIVAMVVLGAPVMASAADTTPPPSTTAPSTTTPTTEPSPTTPPADLPPATGTPPSTDTPPATDAPITTPPTGDTTPLGGAPLRDAAPAVQVTPTLTVTPSTNLVNHQTVTVAGSGWTPNVGIGWAGCKNGGSGQNDCDLQNTGYATSDATGAFSATFTVHRILHTVNGDVDCATAPQTCTVGAGKVSNPTSEHAGAPISFDPSIPLPPPAALLAFPTTGLVEGQTVGMFGKGFVPSGAVYVVECSVPSVQTCQVLNTVTADATGGFITTVDVHRVLPMQPFASTDCASAPGTCRLRAVSGADYDFSADAFLTFDPNGPLPSFTVTVTPHTGLLNFQAVTVAGSGFTSSFGVQVIECKSAATSYQDCAQSGGSFAPTSPTGEFSLPYSVRRILHLTGGDFDCASAVDACSLVSTSFGSNPIVVASPVSFDNSVPPPLPPTISVTPATALVQGQQVTVTGSNFAPNAFLQLGECLTGFDPSGYCPFNGGSGAQADANGSFSTTFTVKRGVLDFSGYPPSIVDCAGAPQKCSINAFSYDGGDSASAPIDFDPSVPIHVPTASVSPQFGLPDRAVVAVHSSGFAPGERVLVSQCDGDVPVGGSCTNGPVDIHTADAQGVVDTTLRVHRTLDYFGGFYFFTTDTANCAAAVGQCVVRVQSIDDALSVKDVPLGFDPTAVAPPPVITTSPAGPYTDGEQVTVHGSGFTPGGTLGLAQCAAGVEPGGPTCDSQPGGLFDAFTADQNGEFSRTVTIHAQVQSTDVTIDCAGGATGCVLFAANRNDYDAERVGIPVTFASTGIPAPVHLTGVSPARALAFTGAGSSTQPLALAGIALLLVGGALVLVSRRRRVSA
ncbi:MAG: hypothetical protein QOF40_2764 [Actinomycetota bacterium]|nr:hypothetical protein [Actinomycetota bacterium]